MPALPKSLEAVLDLIYPPICLVCGRLDGAFCDECRAAVVPVTRDSTFLQGLGDVHAAGFHDGPLRDAVIRLKYHRKVALVEPLTDLLSNAVAPLLPHWEPEAFVPVPLHWARQWERGFNQSQLLTEALARRHGVPSRSLLTRRIPTPPQVGLSQEERLRNLDGAIAIRRNAGPVPRRVVLVDDVRTTGATLMECSHILKQAGVRHVFGLTLTADQ